MKKIITALLICIILGIGFSFLFVYAGIDWTLFGKNCNNTFSGKTELDKVKYITSEVGKRLNDLGIKANMNRIDRGFFGKNEVGTCGDVSQKLCMAFEGAGIKSNTCLVLEKKQGLLSTILDPLDVNYIHGTPVVVVDGKVYVCDLWVHAGSNNKSFNNAQASEWNCMPLGEYIDRVKRANYRTFSTDSPGNGDGKVMYNTAVEALMKDGIFKSEAPLTTLKVDESWQENFKGGKYIELQARINGAKPAGGNYCLEIAINGKKLSAPLANKGQSFRFQDGRTFSYYGGPGAWLLFYSPNFSINNSKQAGGYQVLQGQACTYRWSLSNFFKPDEGDVGITVKLYHNGRSSGQPVSFSIRVLD
jgi:hypothetical protein